MFLAFDYGLMYVLSFATLMTVFASAIALMLGPVMIVGRSVWRWFAKWEPTRTEALAGAWPWPQRTNLWRERTNPPTCLERLRA
jgi:hypothetical protein